MLKKGVLEGKVAIITGAGRGIGREIALAMSAEGASVVLAARTFSEVEETAKLIHAKGKPALAQALDVSDWDAVQKLTARVVQEFGTIHILVNNAGILGAIGPLVENDPVAWEQAIRVNLLGTFYCCKAVLPFMIAQCYGKIISLSGGGATAARSNFSAYGASKAGIVRVMETLAEELKAYNIQVNTIAPGAVNTRMLDEMLAAGAQAGAKVQVEAENQQKMGGTSPEVAASLAVFLASDASIGLTGRLISAPHDDWRKWDENGIKAVMAAPWFTLRRIDPYTLKQIESKRLA